MCAREAREGAVMSSSPTADHGRAIRPGRRPAPPFGSIVCGVNGSRMDAEVAHQAALLAGPDTPLDIVAVAWEIGSGVSAQATLTAGHADRALARAAHIAPRHGRLDVDPPRRGRRHGRRAAHRGRRPRPARPRGRARAPLRRHRHRAPRHRGPAPRRQPRAGRPAGAGRGALPRAHPLRRRRVAVLDVAAALVAAIAGRHGAHVDLASPPGMDAAGRDRVAAHAVAIVDAGAPEPALLDVVRGAHHADAAAGGTSRARRSSSSAAGG